MTNTIKAHNVHSITAQIPCGNFANEYHATAYCDAIRKIAARDYPEAELTIEELSRQTNGGAFIVLSTEWTEDMDGPHADFAERVRLEHIEQAIQDEAAKLASA